MIAAACTTPAPRGEADAPKPTLRQVRKAATAAKVLQAARRVFQAEGFEAATMRDIAYEAGLSTGAIFTSYAGKAALYRAAFGHAPITPEVGRLMLRALEAAELRTACPTFSAAQDREATELRQVALDAVRFA